MDHAKVQVRSSGSDVELLDVDIDVDAVDGEGSKCRPGLSGVFPLWINKLCAKTCGRFPCISGVNLHETALVRVNKNG